MHRLSSSKTVRFAFCLLYMKSNVDIEVVELSKLNETTKILTHIV